MNTNILDKAIYRFGYEDERTIAIARCEERGAYEEAEAFYASYLALTELISEFLEDDYDELGFDPYEGCYTYDC